MNSASQQGASQSWCREIGNTGSERSQAETLPNLLHSDSSRRNVASLTQVIEAEIIPRLMLVHSSAALSVPVQLAARDTVEQDEINEFSRLILAHDLSIAAAYVHTMLASGLRLETLYLDLFTPAARQLGERWEADLCDFTQVTMGLWRLQQLLHDLSPAFQKDDRTVAEANCALLVPAPGEQHTFGLFMVAEFFRRAGWHVWSELPPTFEDMFSTVRRHHFEIFGLSIARESELEDLAKNIKGIRKASKNRSIGVMVGGPIFVQRPELVAAVGADMTASDGEKAVEGAEKLAALQETS